MTNHWRPLCSYQDVFAIFAAYEEHHCRVIGTLDMQDIGNLVDILRPRCRSIVSLGVAEFRMALVLVQEECKSVGCLNAARLLVTGRN